MQKYRTIYTSIFCLCRFTSLMAITSSVFALTSPSDLQQPQTPNANRSIPAIITGTRTIPASTPTTPVNTQDHTTKKEAAKPSSLQLNISNYIKLNMGQHSFNNSRLLYSNIKSEGFSSAIYLPELNSQLHAYRLYDNTDNLPATAFDSKQQGNSRANGFMWRYQPTHNNENKLLFTANYLSGHTGHQSPEKLSGDSSSVTLDTFFHHRKLHFYGEYAHSQQDTDSHTRNKQAYHTILSYSPYFHTQGPNKKRWAVGFEKKRIEPHFFSAFNSQLDYGLEVDRVFGHYEKGGWKLEYSLQQQESYFDNQSALIEDAHYSHFSINYNKPKKYAQHSYWYWLGKPSYQFNHYYKTQELTDTFLLTKNTLKENNVDIGANFLYSHWHWHLKLHRNRFTNENFPSETSLSNNVNFNTEIRLKNNKKLLATRQLNRTQKDISNDKQVSSAYTLAIEKLLTIKRTNHTILLAIGEINNKAVQSEHHKKQTISSTITYPLLPPSVTFPGMDIKLTGNYERISDHQDEGINKDYGLTIDFHLLWGE